MIGFIKKYLNKKKLQRHFPNVIFGSNITIENIELIKNLTFTKYAYIGSSANWSLRGKINIGNNVIIGPRSVIWPYNHNYNSNYFIPYGESKEDIINEITINDNVWLGMGVTILAGVSISEGAIIAANSVVSKNVPKCAIVAGNPAKIIKYRDIDKYEKLKINNHFYLNYKQEKVRK